MILNGNLLGRKYGKKIITETAGAEKCCCAACSIAEQCEYPDAFDGCGFKSMNKEDLIKIILIYETLCKSGSPKEYHMTLDALYDIAIRDHKLSLYDMYVAKEEYVMCEHCGGSGAIIDADGVHICKHCDGNKLREREHDDDMVAEFIYNEYGFSYSTIHQDVKRISELDSGKKPFYMKKKYIAINSYGQPIFAHDRKYIVLLKEQKVPETIGTYMEIHDAMGIPYFIDIEDVTDDKYQVFPEEGFWESFKIVPVIETDVTLSKETYDKMREDLFMSNLWLYEPHATYTCTELISKYAERFKTVDDVIVNVLSHIDEYENSVVKSDKVIYLEKIINDGELIGLELTKLQAAKIMEQIISVTDDQFYPQLMVYNTIIIFIVEYICIYKEFGNLTE